jgi:hypothetical protein
MLSDEPGLLAEPADTENAENDRTGVIQIAVASGSSLRDLLAARGLFLYRVQDVGDVPTYGIGFITTGAVNCWSARRSPVPGTGEDET